MATGNFVAYYRVSTVEQGRSGLGLEAQREAVRAYLDGGCWRLIGEHIEVESGRGDDRPRLAASFAQCRLTGATLVIAKLDRLSRNVAFLAKLMDGDIEFVAVDNPHATRFTLHILAAVAEHEATQISARTKAALAAAKARGRRLGGWRAKRRDGSARLPPGDPATATAASQARAAEHAARVRPIAVELRGEGLSLRQIAALLTERHVATLNGGHWSASGVHRLLRGREGRPA
jgi:DNA invertase Pin-like site-specific DNA recombinase